MYVVFTVRNEETDKEIYRIISARLAEPGEKKILSQQNSTRDISDNRVYILETTQEDYDEMKARGIDEEAIPSVGKHIFRRRTRKINPRDAKIKTTVCS